MQRSEVFEFLDKIDKYVGKNYQSILGAEKFELKIIGKCSLILAGMVDSIGTVDLDSLQIEGKLDPKINEVVKASLLIEFGRSKQSVHGYYLELHALNGSHSTEDGKH